MLSPRHKWIAAGDILTLFMPPVMSLLGRVTVSGPMPLTHCNIFPRWLERFRNFFLHQPSGTTPDRPSPDGIHRLHGIPAMVSRGGGWTQAGFRLQDT